MKEKEVWDMLITRAEEVLNPRTISPFIEAGGVGAAILTWFGNRINGKNHNRINSVCHLNRILSAPHQHMEFI